MILNNENYCATIIRIKSTVKLDGLDNLVGVPLFGFNALVPKDYDLDQLYVFFTAESQLSDKYCFENNLFDKSDLNKDKAKKGYINNKRRVRAVKLRGNVSSALIMPISSLGYLGDISHLKEGDMFNVLADEEVCKKYIIRTQQASGPKSTKIKTRQLFNSKLFPEHIDTSNWGRNHSSVNDDAYIIVSQKLHGTSFRLTHQKMIQFPKWLVRLYNKGFGNWKIGKFLEKLFRKSDYQLIAGSRTVVKIRDTDQVGFYCSDLWNQALDKIGHLIPKNWVIYGELIGWSNNSPIQKGYTYDQKAGCFDIYVYRIAVVNEDGISVDLPYDGMKKWCSENGVKICPEMWRGHKKDFDYEDFMDMRYVDRGYSQCLPLSDPKTVDEGVVIRIDNGLTPSLYKAKSPVFLGHETKQLDDGVVSIEDEESLKGEAP